METSPRFCENCGQPLFLGAKFCGTCGQPVKPLPAAPPAAPAPETPPPAQPAQGDFYPPQPPPQVGSFPPQGGQYAQPGYDAGQYPPPAPGYPGEPAPATPYPQPPVPAPGPAFFEEQILGVIPGASRKRGILGMSADPYTLVVTNQRILFATLTKEITRQEVEKARETAKAQGKGQLSQWGAQLTTNVGQRYYAMDPQSILAEHPGNFFYLNSQIRAVRISRYADQETFRTEYTLELDTVSGKVKLTFAMLNEGEVRGLLAQTLGPIVR